MEIFSLHSKPLIVSAIYRPPNQGSSTETITEHFPKINTNYFQFCFFVWLRTINEPYTDNVCKKSFTARYN